MLLGLFFFVLTLVYLFMGVYALQINPRAVPNRIYIFITIIFAGWSFSALLSNMLSTPEIDFLWRFFASMAWSFGASAILHFALELTKKSKSHKIDSLYLWLYLPAFILYMGNKYLNLIDVDMPSLNWLFGPLVSTGYYLVMITLACVILYSWGKRSTKPRERIQSKLIISGLFVSTLLTAGYEACAAFVILQILPMLGFTNSLIVYEQVRHMFVTPAFPIFWVSAMYIAITKYRFLTFRPDIATYEIMDNILDLLILVDSEGNIIEVNKRTEILLNYEKNNLINQPFVEIVLGNDELMPIVKQMISGELSIYNGESIYMTSERLGLPVRLIITTVKDASTEVLGLVVAAQDLRQENQYRTLSITDTLTQLNNRLKLDELLQYEILRSSRNNMPLSIAMMDIDHFKLVNDSHGHQNGDLVLVEIAKLLKTSIRHSDTVGRWGGEEFLIILPETDLVHATVLIEKLRIAVADMILPFQAKVTCSFGIVQFRDDDIPETMVSRADAALYCAKDKGRNRYEIESKD